MVAELNDTNQCRRGPSICNWDCGLQTRDAATRVSTGSDSDRVTRLRTSDLGFRNRALASRTPDGFVRTQELGHPIAIFFVAHPKLQASGTF